MGSRQHSPKYYLVSTVLLEVMLNTVVEDMVLPQAAAAADMVVAQVVDMAVDQAGSLRHLLRAPLLVLQKSSNSASPRPIQSYTFILISAQALELVHRCRQ